ncbi:MAG: PEP-CTERM sorting domain-containing protein [Verrucomicrobia bacterium]|nr:PEP-CTERM sorting domain-containing protein [Verrucomicrobiota bacterium]
MKAKQYSFGKNHLAVGLVGVTVLTLSSLSNAAEIISTGHVDIGVAYEDGGWDLHVHNEDTDTEYEPGEAILQLGSSTLTSIPADSRFSFLGTSGSPIYLLSSLGNPNQILLGVAAEEVEPGVFVNDSLKLTLTAFSGPGAFHAYRVDGLTGNPLRAVSAANGMPDAVHHVFDVLAQGHQDYNWAFTEQGDYKLTFRASGDLAGGGSSMSDEVVYQFQVVPEPSTLSLAALGALIWLRSTRRRTDR